MGSKPMHKPTRYVPWNQGSGNTQLIWWL